MLPWSSPATPASVAIGVRTALDEELQQTSGQTPQHFGVVGCTLGIWGEMAPGHMLGVLG